MSFEILMTDLINKGVIKKCPVDKRAAGNLIKRAIQDLRTAKHNLSFDCECSYEYAYNAMLRSSLAMMRYCGYRPSIKNKHINVVKFAEVILSDSFESLIIEYDMMRKQRNRFIYEPMRACSQSEAGLAISISKEFCTELVSRMPDVPGQKEFDFKE